MLIQQFFFSLLVEHTDTVRSENPETSRRMSIEVWSFITEYEMRIVYHLHGCRTPS